MAKLCIDNILAEAWSAAERQRLQHAELVRPLLLIIHLGLD